MKCSSTIVLSAPRELWATGGWEEASRCVQTGQKGGTFAREVRGYSTKGLGFKGFWCSARSKASRWPVRDAGKTSEWTWLEAHLSGWVQLDGAWHAGCGLRWWQSTRIRVDCSVRGE